MTGEYTITQQTYETNFRGEHDALTHQAYAVGDVVVRCGSCRRVIKAEFVDGCCPLCGSAPFTSAPVIVQRVSIRTPTYPHRSENLFYWLVSLSTVFSIIPLFFEGASQFLSECMFGLCWDWVYFLIFAAAGIAGLVLALCPTTQRFWVRNRWGPVLLAIPPVTPYAILTCIWAVIGIAYLAVCILMIGIVIGIMCAFIAGMSEL